MSDPQTGPSSPLPPLALDDVLSAIGNRYRWRILRELASGEQLMVAEIAERVGLTPDATSKAISVLRDLRIVLQGRNRLYTLAPQFLADKENRVVDFGYCLLRLNVGAPIKSDR